MTANVDGFSASSWQINLKKALFIFLSFSILCFAPPSAWGLIAGICFSLFLGNPFPVECKKIVTPLLQLCIVALGAGMNLHSVLLTGFHGFISTLLGIAFTIFVGDVLLRKIFKSASDTSFLITVGTAICGGSAIAAVSGVMGAKEHDISVALVTVFALNALALVLFPPLGHLAGLSDVQFGLWSALAIHDTSSVVGASMQYGARALEVATTVKLARALWIVPLTFAVSMGFIGRKNTENAKAAKKPWFILGFLASAALVSVLPELQPYGRWIASLAKRVFVFILFLIGAGLTKSSLRAVGIKPFFHGLTLWVIVSAASLMAIYARLID